MDAGLVKVARSTPRGDLQMFLLTALRVGSTELRVVASNSTVWDTCSLHVHMPRRKQLPKWDDLSANYAGDEETSEDFRTRIGGQVDNDQLTNTCTLRMSEAFNQAGQAIPKHHPGLLTLTGADHHSYALRVAEFKRFMLSAYGPPDVIRTSGAGSQGGVSRADFAGLRGVMCFEVHFSDATGHFTLWDGFQALHGDYFDRAFRVSIWMAE
jgi:hypothetical protein